MLLSTPLRTLRFPLVALLLFFSVDGLLSQIVDQWDATSEIGGRFYYLTLPDTTDNTQDSRHTSGRLGDPESFALLVYSPVAQQVRIGRSGSSGMPVSVEAGEMVELDLRSLSVPMNTTRNTPSRDVIKVESAEPIILYVYMSNHFGVAAYTPLPVEAWGREYFVAVWPSDYVRNVYPAGEWDYDATEKKSSPSFITIVAAYDSTEVRIEPTDSLVHCDGCTTITLDRGQSYMVQSFTDTALASGDRTQPDLAGTRVTANRPIGLMSGNTRTNIEGPVAPALAGNAVKDLVVEWIRPIGLHGTEYVQMPMLDGRHPRQEFDAERQREAEIVRLVASSAIPSGGVMIGAGGTLAIEGGKQIDTGAFLEQRLALTDRVEAHLFRTEEPMQAFQAPKGIIAFRGTTGSGQFLGAAYDTWGTSRG